MSVRTAAIWSMGSQYAGFLIQFITSVIISRYFLLPAEMGLFSIALAAALLIAVLQDFGLTRYVSGLPTIEPGHLAICSSVAILSSGAIAAVIALAAWPLAAFYDQQGLAPVLLVIALSYAFVPFSAVPSALLSRDLDFRGLFKVNVGAAIIQGIVVVVLAALGFSALSLAWAMVAGAAVKAIVAQRLRLCLPPLPLKFKGMRPVIAFGSASSLLYMIGSISVRAPELMIGRVLGLTAVGLFSRANALADQFRMLIGGAIGQVFYPAFAKIRDRGEAMGPPYIRVVAGYTAIIWPGMAGLALVSPPLVGFLYGPNWIEVAPLLTLLALSEILFIALPLHMDLPILMGRMATLIRLNILDTAAALVTLAIGISMGLEYAAVARIVYAAIWLAIYARFMHGLIAFDIATLCVVYAKSAAATLAAITPLLLLFGWFVDRNTADLLVVALASAAGVGLWFAALFLVRHPATPEITAVLRQILAHIPFFRLPQRLA